MSGTVTDKDQTLCHLKVKILIFKPDCFFSNYISFIPCTFFIWTCFGHFGHG